MLTSGGQISYQWLPELPVRLSKCRTVRDYHQRISVRGERGCVPLTAARLVGTQTSYLFHHFYSYVESIHFLNLKGKELLVGDGF